MKVYIAMRFHDTENRHHFRYTREALVALCAAGALTLAGCEKPLSSEQKASQELRTTANDSAYAILELMERPESMNGANKSGDSHTLATNPAARPLLFARSEQLYGKNWLTIGAGTPDEQGRHEWTTITLLYELSQPLGDNSKDPVMMSDVRESMLDATLAASTVYVASGHPYSAVFRDGQGEVSITNDLLPRMIDNSSIEADPAYELLKTTQIVLRNATDKVTATTR